MSRSNMRPVKQEEPTSDDDVDVEERANEGTDDADDDNLDTTCGFGLCRKIGFLNKYLANKNTFIFVYGVLGCVYGSTYAYSNSTLSTIEKRYKIPSKVTGVISVGNDISSLFAAVLLSYYAGKGHRPRWMALGIFCVAMFCFITLLPHLVWGAGEDALALTKEYGGVGDSTDYDVQLTIKRKTLCRAGFNDSLAGAECAIPGNVEESGVAPAVLFFIAQFISGIGGSLYYTLGTSYMDDNIKKSKTPALVSVTYFMKMLGPAVGYSIGSYFLKKYIDPSLTPTINNTDPRWLGAWWAGWAVLGSMLLVLAVLISMFPHTMPRTLARRREARARGEQVEKAASSEKATLTDMLSTIKRLFKNKIFMCNSLAAIFYMFGFMPFWMYTPKYIEVQYRVSAARASFFTGSVGLVFSAFGILISGFVITRFKPGARSLAFWNVFVSLVAVAATIIYPFLGCAESDQQMEQMVMHKEDVRQACNMNCDCDFVKYSPVCSEDGLTTFISACHAGCRDHESTEEGKKIFTDCSCIPNLVSAAAFQLSGDPLEVSNLSVQQLVGSNDTTTAMSVSEVVQFYGGRAFSGPCPVDCSTMFYSYIALVCILKFTGSSGRTSNFLVSVRCVKEKDKATSLGFSMMLFSLFVFVPSPIIFGYIIDSTCVVWGKTCTRKGNCWLYDGESMRYIMNFTAAVFVFIGTAFDVGVWYFVKDLQIFETEPKPQERKSHEEQELIEVQRSDNGLAKPVKRDPPAEDETQ